MKFRLPMYAAAILLPLSVSASEVVPFGPLQFGSTIVEVQNLICTEDAIKGLKATRDLCSPEKSHISKTFPIYQDFEKLSGLEQELASTHLNSEINNYKTGVLGGEYPVSGGTTSFGVAPINLFGAEFDLYMDFSTSQSFLIHQALNTDEYEKFCFSVPGSDIRLCEYPSVLTTVQLVGRDGFSLNVIEEIKDSLTKKYTNVDNVKFSKNWDQDKALHTGMGTSISLSKDDKKIVMRITRVSGVGKVLSITYDAREFFDYAFKSSINQYVNAMKEEKKSASTGSESGL